MSTPEINIPTSYKIKMTVNSIIFKLAFKWRMSLTKMAWKMIPKTISQKIQIMAILISGEVAFLRYDSSTDPKSLALSVSDSQKTGNMLTAVK